MISLFNVETKNVPIGSIIGAVLGTTLVMGVHALRMGLCPQI